MTHTPCFLEGLLGINVCQAASGGRVMEVGKQFPHLFFPCVHNFFSSLKAQRFANCFFANLPRAIGLCFSSESFLLYLPAFYEHLNLCHPPIPPNHCCAHMSRGYGFFLRKARSSSLVLKYASDSLKWGMSHLGRFFMLISSLMLEAFLLGFLLSRVKNHLMDGISIITRSGKLLWRKKGVFPSQQVLC